MMNNVHVGWGPVGLTTILSNKQTKLRLNKSSVSLEKGGSFKIEVLSNYVDSLIWESSNPDVAVVDDEGNVTVLGYGTAKITVTSGELKGSCTITVKEEPVINPPVEPDEPVVPEEPENKLDNTKMYYGYITPALGGMSVITEDIIINAFINKDENNMVNNDIDYEAVTEFYLDVPENKIAIILLPDNSICAKKNVLGYLEEFSCEIPNFSANGDGEIISGFYLYGELNISNDVLLLINLLPNG